MLRRVAALLTGLLMAHLTFVGSDFACAVHPGDTAGVPHAGSSDVLSGTRIVRTSAVNDRGGSCCWRHSHEEHPSGERARLASLGNHRT